MRRFSADEIAPFFEASPLAHSRSCREVLCQKMRGRLLLLLCPPFLKKYFPCVCVCGPGCQMCVCACVCVDICISFGSVWVFRCGTQVCKCVGSSWGKKKDLYTGLKSLIKGWQIFLASCVVLKQLLGSSSLGLPPFFAPTFSHP